MLSHVQGILIFSIGLPVLGVWGTTFILMRGKLAQAEATSIDRKTFDSLTNALREENAQLRLEVSAMKETLDAVHAMMKEID